jgi:hypothetical protein
MSLKIESLNCPKCGDAVSSQGSNGNCGSCGTEFIVFNGKRGVEVCPVLPEQKIMIPENGDKQTMMVVTMKRSYYRSANTDANHWFVWRTYEDQNGNWYVGGMHRVLDESGWKRGKHSGLFAFDLVTPKTMVYDDPRDYVSKIINLCQTHQLFAMVNPVESPDILSNPDMYYYENFEHPQTRSVRDPGKSIFHRHNEEYWQPYDSFLAPVTYTATVEGNTIHEKFRFSYLGYPGSTADSYRMDQPWVYLERDTQK